MYYKSKSRQNRNFVWTNPDTSLNESSSNPPANSLQPTKTKDQAKPQQASTSIDKSSVTVQKPISTVPRINDLENSNVNSFSSPSISTSSQNSHPSNLSQLNKPHIHLFVCDNGNTKVKLLTQQFIDLLLKNGIDVYAERYLTHQPGYQVKAAAIQTKAHFFFQIHSHTATSGHVRLYQGVKPQRMHINKAVLTIWSRWRMMNGALTTEEVEVLSREKLLFLLNKYAKIDFENINIDEVQHLIQDAIFQGKSTKSLSQRLQEFEIKLQNAKAVIANAPTVSTDFVIQQGTVLPSIVPSPIPTSLSIPLKFELTFIIDQALQKIAVLHEISKRYQPEVALESDENLSNFNELEFKNSQEMDEIGIFEAEPKAHDGSSWGIMIESLDENRVCSMNIASFGDDYFQSSLDHISTPIFLDDYDL